MRSSPPAEGETKLEQLERFQFYERAKEATNHRHRRNALYATSSKRAGHLTSSPRSLFPAYGWIFSARLCRSPLDVALLRLRSGSVPDENLCAISSILRTSRTTRPEKFQQRTCAPHTFLWSSKRPASRPNPPKVVYVLVPRRAGRVFADAGLEKRLLESWAWVVDAGWITRDSHRHNWPAARRSRGFGELRAASRRP